MIPPRRALAGWAGRGGTFFLLTKDMDRARQVWAFARAELVMQRREPTALQQKISIRVNRLKPKSTADPAFYTQE
jgi:hypothetical protein